MDLKKYFFVFLLGIIFTSCKKDYQCECTNSYSTYDAGDKIQARTKNSANKKCQDLSSSSTTCKVK